MSIEKIDKSDFDIWYKSTITQDILKSLKARKEVLEKQIMNLACGDDLKAFYSIKYIRGLVAGYDELINISYSDMEERNE
jgi:hypothetical protein